MKNMLKFDLLLIDEECLNFGIMAWGICDSLKAFIIST